MPHRSPNATGPLPATRSHRPYARDEHRQPERRRAWARRLLRLGLSVGLVAAVLVAAGLGALLYDLPLRPASEARPARSLTLEAADGRRFAFRGRHRGGQVAFADLPRHLVQAVVAIEDRRFFSHGGLDLRGLLRALAANLQAGAVKQGGSTITQQYVKLAFLTPERSLRRKAQEALLAFWLESRASKEEIFSLYINQVYFGAGATGINAAARRYFAKAPGDLSLAESAMLAGLIRAPSRLAPTHNLPAAQERARVVLEAMVAAGALDPASAEAAAAQPAAPAAAPASVPSAGYFSDWAAARAAERLGPVGGDFTLRTTFDPTLQSLAETVLAEHLARDGERLAVGQAAIVALAPDGAVRAMVGGRSYADSQFNRATQAQRQPGSLFKLFVALGALRAGFSPESRLVDEPIAVEGWRPKNYGGGHVGPVTLRRAFADSINTVSVQLTEMIGREAVMTAARDLGIGSPLAPHPSLALGTSDVNLLEITAAYGVLLADHPKVIPYGIQALRAGAQDLYRHRAAAAPALATAEREVRRDLRDLLGAVVRGGTGRAADPGEPAVGKTGTSQDHRDAWFVGMTADLVVGVWVGNDDNTPMKGVTGGTLPARIRRDFMVRSRAHRNATRSPDRVALVAQPAPNRQDAVASGREAPAAERKIQAAAPVEPAPARRRPSDEADDGVISGLPDVLDVGTIRFGERVVRLLGVEPGGTAFVGSLRAYIGGRPVTCRPVGRPVGRRGHRCEVGRFDLSEVVIFNGGARATREAPPYLRRAEDRARAARRGIWSPR